MKQRQYGYIKISVIGGGKKNIFDLTGLTYDLINDSEGAVKGEDVQKALKKYGLHKEKLDADKYKNRHRSRYSNEAI